MKYKRKKKYKKNKKTGIDKHAIFASGAICKSNKCFHEKCHHLKFIRHIWKMRKKHKFNFYPTLLPYHKLYHQKEYGIIPGLPDFHFNIKFVQNGVIIYTSLDIELKVGELGKLSEVQKEVIRELMEDGQHLVGVCFGVDACKDLLNAYLNPTKTTVEELEELCWAGKISKNDVLSEKKKK